MVEEETAPKRLSLRVRGAVQGVGFRPFVYRLAAELGLSGWVLNDASGVRLEVEGPRERLARFLHELRSNPPPRALIETVEEDWLEPAGHRGFVIRSSDGAGAPSAVVLPDIATCPDCLAEVLDPSDRRHRYPFTNCTNCGPRFTIVEALPYDRPQTTMRRFTLCRECQAEYDDPADRRFHAQPNACPRCGPRLELATPDGQSLAAGEEALRLAAAALGEGKTVALKGLGGYQLLTDARSETAVELLRRRKHRWEKPFALMVRDLEAAREICEVPEEAARALESAEAPIVLLAERPAAGIAHAVAPDNPHLGVMLPTTPLHHLLLREAGIPLVATSGNLSDEPIATGDAEALERLGPLADFFLRHDRPIARHADDSVVTIARGEARLLRRARGYAPLPILSPRPLPTLLATGPHLKATVALSLGERVFLSQHLGDLETPQSLAAFERVVADFLDLYQARPVAIAHDLHPDYASTLWASETTRAIGSSQSLEEGQRELAGLPLVAVQHHHAHLASCLFENGTSGPALGVTWDGTGYGTDGTIWGGEFLLGDARDFERVAHLLPFRLPGGEAAVREPRRSALALLWELEGEAALERRGLPALESFEPREKRLLSQLLERGLNAPTTTSAGRLCDGVAALLGLHLRSSFEGQAAMALEFLADPAVRDAYPLPLEGHDPAVLDWRPTIEAILDDLAREVSREIVAARFHNALVEGIAAVTREVGETRVALSGGCFQNRWLLERAAEALERSGFEVLLHRRVPPGDGGVSLGQIAVAAARSGD